MRGSARIRKRPVDFGRVTIGQFTYPKSCPIVRCSMLTWISLKEYEMRKSNRGPAQADDGAGDGAGTGADNVSDGEVDPPVPV